MIGALAVLSGGVAVLAVDNFLVHDGHNHLATLLAAVGIVGVIIHVLRLVKDLATWLSPGTRR